MFYGAKPKIFEYARQLRQSMTEAEQLLWEQLKNKNLGYRFKPQHPVDTFIVDFYCHKQKLAVEIDGEIHKNQIDYDDGRSYELLQLGIKIIRFNNKDVIENIEKVIEEIKSNLNNL